MRTPIKVRRQTRNSSRIRSTRSSTFSVRRSKIRISHRQRNRRRNVGNPRLGLSTCNGLADTIISIANLSWTEYYLGHGGANFQFLKVFKIDQLYSLPLCHDLVATVSLQVQGPLTPNRL